MRLMLALVAVLYSTAALAQAGSPPAAASKPPAQAKSKAPEKKQPMAVRLQECLDIEDGTKERLNCYDAVIPPAPKPTKAGAAKGVMDCKFAKEEDERLTCYNGFVESIPKLPKS